MIGIRQCGAFAFKKLLSLTPTYTNYFSNNFKHNPKKVIYSIFYY